MAVDLYIPPGSTRVREAELLVAGVRRAWEEAVRRQQSGLWLSVEDAGVLSERIPMDCRRMQNRRSGRPMRTFLRCLLSAWWCLSLSAQTTVTGTLADPIGDLVSGSCSIAAVAPYTAANGWRIVGAPVVVKFTSGLLSVSLAPTDTATPSGQYYRVSCQMPVQTLNGRSVGPYSWGPRYWLVPTSSVPVDISSVEIPSPPPAGAGVPWLHAAGNYSASVTYNMGDVVQYGGSSYLASVSSNLGHTPSISPTYWNVLAQGAGASCAYTVAASATPTFDFQVCRQQVMTLESDIAPTLTNISECRSGCTVTLIQGASPYAVTWPASVFGGFQPGAIPGKRNAQSFAADEAGHLIAVTLGVVNQ